MILNNSFYKKIGLAGLSVALLGAGVLSLYDGLVKPAPLNLTYQTQKIENREIGVVKFQIDEMLQYQINRGESESFELTVAKYKNSQGKQRQAIVFPGRKSSKIPVLHLNDLRNRAWQQAAQAITQHVGSPNSLIISWWDNAQRLDLMTGINTWVSSPASESYYQSDLKAIWSAISGGFDTDSSKLKQLAEWLLMDADLAIKSINKVISTDQQGYLLFSIDDLARLQEIFALSDRKLAIDSRVFYTGDNIHTQISRVKQWAKAEGTGSYLVQPLPGIGVRAWRILDQQSEKMLLVRLLPFTHSLEQPLETVNLVFQSEWGGYLSVFELTK